MLKMIELLALFIVSKPFFAPTTLQISTGHIKSVAKSEENTLSQKVASYDIKQRIKQLGGGPFCINQDTDKWVAGNPRQSKIGTTFTCNEWRAGHMASDRRIKEWVSSCTCIN